MLVLLRASQIGIAILSFLWYRGAGPALKRPDDSKCHIPKNRGCSHEPAAGSPGNDGSTIRMQFVRSGA